MSSILDLFASSPMKPMQKHMEKVLECVSYLDNFLEAVCAEQWDEVEKRQQQISALENEADELKKALRLNLPSGLFMPVSRIDLLSLLKAQDKVANLAKDIAGLMTGRRMVIPQSLQSDMKNYLSRSIEAAAQAGKAIQQLDELLETGFKGKEVAIVEEMVEQLDAIENDVDGMQIKLRRAVFDMEAHMSAVDVIFLYKVIEWIGQLADRAQQVGSRLELLLAR